MFTRFYQGQYPRRNFYLLVVGRREKLKLHVHQVWRLYPAVMEFTPSNNLMGMLRKFAEAYGSEFLLNGETAKMVVSASMPAGTRQLEVTAVIKPGQKPFRTMTSFFFNQPDVNTGDLGASLIVSINVTAYQELLEEMHWEEPTLPRSRLTSPLSKDD